MYDSSIEKSNDAFPVIREQLNSISTQIEDTHIQASRVESLLSRLRRNEESIQKGGSTPIAEYIPPAQITNRLGDLLESYKKANSRLFNALNEIETLI